jgi:hypothetical protein
MTVMPRFKPAIHSFLGPYSVKSGRPGPAFGDMADTRSGTWLTYCRPIGYLPIGRIAGAC